MVPIWVLLASMLALVVACYGADLEEERFSCINNEDCAEGFQCRTVGLRQFCLSEDSDDVRLCETYCRDFFVKCDTEQTNPFEDEDDCLAQCDRIPATGEIGDTSGDTVQCRFYHIGVAREGDTTHCPHAWPLARAGGCTGDCFDFCRDFQSECGSYTDDATSQTADRDECRRDCQEFQRTDRDNLGAEPTGNTLECRRVYLEAANDFTQGTDEHDEACQNARSDEETGGQCR